jgi:TrmH family RNA methyltransferase
MRTTSIFPFDKEKFHQNIPRTAMRIKCLAHIAFGIPSCIFYIHTIMKSYPRLTQAQSKYYQKLVQKKYRQSERKFIVEGVHLVDEALQSEWEVESVLLTADFLKTSEVKRLEQGAKSKGLKVFEISESELKKLSDTATAQGALAVVRTKENGAESLWKSLPKKSVIVALENVSDPGNVGTIIRTCDWFGVDAVVLDEHSTELYNPKVVRSTMGSIFHLPIITDVQLPEALRQAERNGYTIYVTTLSQGEALSSGMFADKTVLVFGNEARGVTSSIQELADKFVTIPRFGRAESLNVATSCAVVLSSLKL